MATRYYIDPLRGGDPTNIEILKKALRCLGCGRGGKLIGHVFNRPDLVYVTHTPDKALSIGSQGLEIPYGRDDVDVVLLTWTRLTEFTPNSHHNALLIPKNVLSKEAPSGPGRYSGYFCCFWNEELRRFEQATTDNGNSDGTWITVPKGTWQELVTD